VFSAGSSSARCIIAARRTGTRDDGDTRKSSERRDLDALDLAHLFTEHESRGPAQERRSCSRAQGIHVWTRKASSNIEGMAGLWCTTLGYGDESSRPSLRAAEDSRVHASLCGKSHEPAVRLADSSCAWRRSRRRACFRQLGIGRERHQIKLAWYYNNAVGRRRRRRSSRGRGATTARRWRRRPHGPASFHKNFDVPLPGILHTDAPYYYRGAQPGESQEDYARGSRTTSSS